MGLAITPGFLPSTRSDSNANTTRFMSKTLTFDGTTSFGEVGTVPLFTVTGSVFVEKIVPVCTTDLGVSSGVGTASIQLGVTGATNALIATTVPTAIDAGEFWIDATPDPGAVAVPSALKDLAVCKDIVAEVTNTETVDAEIDTLTFPTKAGATAADYIVISSQSGLTFAVYLDKTGSDTAPTGAAYVAVAASRKGAANITSDTTAAQVAARVETALNALTGFTALITTDDTAANGTMTLTQVTAGDTTNPVPHNATDASAGSISIVETNSGTSLTSLTKVTSGVIRFDILWRPLSPDGAIS